MLSLKSMTQVDTELKKIRHSLAHLLAIAVLNHDPNAKLGIGPVIENGFYYDFLLSKPITNEDLADLEKKMKKNILSGLSFTGETLKPLLARERFENQPFKLELIDEFVSEGKEITAYTSGSFTDLCAGPHVENTKEIDPEAFILTTVAGAYWKGSEKKAMLTRIYGVAFASKDKLENYMKMLEEAKRRDHRILGKELDLFTFSPLVGSGLPLWTPKGTIIRELLNTFVWELREKRGYKRVTIPHITKKALYETSGHWEKFSAELFRITTRENDEFALKPMNCPHHTQLFARHKRSYRELPVRYAETTMVYRDEQSGELSGLSRVRSITQDDAHVFCRTSQIKDEVFAIWDIVDEFYPVFGFATEKIRLSFHDPNAPEKYLGSETTWKIAEDTLRAIAKERKAVFFEAAGEAALYGPKIDFLTKDALGREWQIATIQLDLNLPERFNLYCVNEENKEERIVMIHAAIMGSIERFLVPLIEHLAGSFPLWLSPVQVSILPITSAHNAYAKEVSGELLNAGIRAELHDENETLGKKIREVKKQKTPYYLVIGEKEMSGHTVTIEHRDGRKNKTIDLKTFIDEMLLEIRDKKK